MRVAFFGTSAFAVPSLRKVAQEVVLVVTQPDRPAGRGMANRSSAVREAAHELGLPTATPTRCRDAEFVAQIEALDLDLQLVVAYGQLLSERLLAASRRGGFNLHGSILPKYRGAAPIQWALLNGESTTGVTLMQMDQGMDTGDIIATRKTAIGPEETAGELSARLAEVGADLVAEWLPRLGSGDYPRTPQDDSQATYAPKLTKADAELRFDMSARSAFDRFRATTPTPGAFVQGLTGPIRVRAARLREEDAGAKPGIVIQTSPNLVVAFSSGCLELTTVQPAGKSPMSGRDFANGCRLRVGDAFPGTASRPN